VLVARAPGFRETTVRFTDRPPPHLLALDPAPVTPPPGQPAQAGERGELTDRGAADRGGSERGSTQRAERGRKNDSKKDRGRRRFDRAQANDDGDARAKQPKQPRGNSAGSGLMPNGAPIIE
jgi:hypothetical protein